MRVFRCKSCFKWNNYSTKDLPCPYCGSDDLVEELLNISQTESQPISFSHESAQATGKANSELVGSSCSVHDQNESTSEGLSFPYEDSAYGSKWTHVECRGREIVDITNSCGSNIRLEKEQPSQNFSQCPITNKRLLPETENICVQFSNEEDNDRCHHSRVNILLDPMRASMAKQQHQMNLSHLQSNNENQNQPCIETANKKRKAIDSTRFEKEHKMSFAGSTDFETKKSIPRYYPASVTTKKNRRDTVDEGSTSYADLFSKRENVGSPNAFSEHFENINEAAQQEDHPSQHQTRMEGREDACEPPTNRSSSPTPRVSFLCEKCGKTFIFESVFNAHVRSNCDRRPFRCDLCSKKYSCESSLAIHRRTHTMKSPFKCDQCPFFSNWEDSIKRHKRRCH